MNKFKRFILEALRDEGHTIFGSREELDRSISSMDADTIAEKDYVDEETGEVYLAMGKRAGWSQLHPDYERAQEEKRLARQARWDAEEAAWAVEDEAYEIENENKRENAQREYNTAIENFVDETDMSEVESNDFDGVIPDIAEGFFYEYSQWREWSSLLGISKATMKSLIVDLLADKA